MLGVFKSKDKLGNRLIVILQGLPCSWGKCSFCPFSLEQGELAEVLINNRRIINKAKELLKSSNVDRVTIFNGGSFFELPYIVITWLREICKDKIVDIESRPEFITKESLVNVLETLKPKELVVRVGFENYDETIRNIILNKGIPQSEIHRLAKLREEITNYYKLPIKFIAYVLFGIEGVSEESIVMSVKKFNEMFDGVIAIKYKKYLSTHPNEVPVSKDLAEFLEKNTLLVDWGEGDEWQITKQ